MRWLGGICDFSKQVFLIPVCVWSWKRVLGDSFSYEKIKEEPARNWATEQPTYRIIGARNTRDTRYKIHTANSSHPIPSIIRTKSGWRGRKMKYRADSFQARHFVERCQRQPCICSCIFFGICIWIPKIYVGCMCSRSHSHSQHGHRPLPRFPKIVYPAFPFFFKFLATSFWDSSIVAAIYDRELLCLIMYTKCHCSLSGTQVIDGAGTL